MTRLEWPRLTLWALQPRKRVLVGGHTQSRAAEIEWISTSSGKGPLWSSSRKRLRGKICQVEAEYSPTVATPARAAQVPIFARLLRGSMLSQNKSDYVLAADALGIRKRKIIMGHVFPNSVGPTIVQATLNLATAIIEVAALSFLGAGPVEELLVNGDPSVVDAVDADRGLFARLRFQPWPRGLGFEDDVVPPLQGNEASVGDEPGEHPPLFEGDDRITRGMQDEGGGLHLGQQVDHVDGVVDLVDPCGVRCGCRDSLQLVKPVHLRLCRFRHELVEIRAAEKEAIFQQLDTGERVAIPYDMLHVTPPMGPPAFLAASPLADGHGWVDVHRRQQQHRQ